MLITFSEATTSHKKANKNARKSVKANNFTAYAKDSWNVAPRSKNATLITKPSTKPRASTRIPTRRVKNNKVAPMLMD